MSEARNRKSNPESNKKLGSSTIEVAEKKAASGPFNRDEFKLFVAVVGIYGCYLTSGILQEHIYSFRSETGERFTQTFFLLWIQCIVNVFFSGALRLLGKGSGEVMPYKLFAMAGGAYISAMLCSIEALKYVNFPTKELGKSCKMIPVMLFGVVFARKRYSLRDYICVALITIGIVIFNLSGKHSKKGENSTYGLALLFASLVFDGVTGSTQDNIKRAYKHTSDEMMYWMNLWAAILLTPAILITNQGLTGYKFCLDNPEILRDLFGFAAMAAFGQNFIFFTIKNFNPLVCTTITTTRKFFTILCSVIFFGHPMLPQQWGGVALVFAGIGGNMWGKHQQSKASKRAINGTSKKN